MGSLSPKPALAACQIHVNIRVLGVALLPIRPPPLRTTRIMPNQLELANHVRTEKDRSHRFIDLAGVVGARLTFELRTLAGEIDWKRIA